MSDKTEPLRLLSTSVCILFLLVVPTTAHLLFSWMGFNPTDDGFYLAYSRRIIEGQRPHLDFISIRPVGSAVLHVPFVLLGGEYTFWLSRLFVWFQFACISWVWTTIITGLMKVSVNTVEKVSLSLIGFALSSHNFPIMAWATIDGLFLLSIGLFLCVMAPRPRKVAGYVLVGGSYLCKQNFGAMAIASIVALGDWRQIRYWLALAAPGAIYCGYLFWVGAIPDAMMQIGTRTELFALGIRKYFREYFVPWGTLIGYFGMHLAFGEIQILGLSNRRSVQRLAGTLMLFGVVLGVVSGLGRNGSIGTRSFGLFGAVVGATVYFVLKEPRRNGLVRAGVLALAAAWTVSITPGYNSPALAAGVLAVLVLTSVYLSFQTINESQTNRVPLIALIMLLGVTLFSFGVARQRYIYRERPARELTESLGDVFPGGKLIWTNVNTYNFLSDLRVAVSKTQGRRYTIVPDIAGYWVRAMQTNPLPIDWAQGWELERKAVLDRVMRDMERNRGKVIVIVQKVAADTLADGFVPYASDDYYYAIAQFVRNGFEKVDETQFFELYK